MNIQDLTKLTFYVVENMEANKRQAIINDFLQDYSPYPQNRNQYLK